MAELHGQIVGRRGSFAHRETPRKEKGPPGIGFPAKVHAQCVRPGSNLGPGVVHEEKLPSLPDNGHRGIVGPDHQAGTRGRK